VRWDRRDGRRKRAEMKRGGLEREDVLLGWESEAGTGGGRKIGAGYSSEGW